MIATANVALSAPIQTPYPKLRDVIPAGSPLWLHRADDDSPVSVYWISFDAPVPQVDSIGTVSALVADSLPREGRMAVLRIDGGQMVADIVAVER